MISCMPRPAAARRRPSAKSAPQSASPPRELSDKMADSLHSEHSSQDAPSPIVWYDDQEIPTTPSNASSNGDEAEHYFEWTRGLFHGAALFGKAQFVPKEDVGAPSMEGCAKQPYHFPHVVVGQLPFSFDANALITTLFGRLDIHIIKYDRMFNDKGRPNGQARVYLESWLEVMAVIAAFDHVVLLDGDGAWVTAPVNPLLAEYAAQLPKDYVKNKADEIGCRRVSQQPLSFEWPRPPKKNC